MTAIDTSSEFQVALQGRRVRLPGVLRGLFWVYAPLLALFVLVGALAPFVAPFDPNDQSIKDRLQPPAWQSNGSWEHPLGTDNLGRDMLSRIIYGSRVSLEVVAIAIPLSLVVGTVAGLIAGYWLGIADRVVMRLVDLQLALPAILFAVLLASVYGPGLRNVIVILVVWSWAAYARVVRAQTLSLRERDFITAARAMGASAPRILLVHVAPNVINTVVVVVTLDVGTFILAEASLSFLGVGVPITTPSWGGMISEGRNYITIAWWMVTIPGVAILVISLVANLFGDWLQDALEPRLRRRA